LFNRAFCRIALRLWIYILVPFGSQFSGRERSFHQTGEYRCNVFLPAA